MEYKILPVTKEKYLFRPVAIRGAITISLSHGPVPMVDARRIIEREKRRSKS